MEETKYWLWLSKLYHLGYQPIDRLIQVFGRPSEIFNATQMALIGSQAVTMAQVEEIMRCKDMALVERDYEAMQKAGIKLVTIEDQNYPQELLALYDPPLTLYIKGQMPTPDEWMLAIVGARNCTPYGFENAKHFARSIAVSGMPIVSGMARGIDSAAHWGAIEAGAKTYAVLGCGVDVCYPRDNMELYSQIPEYGALISEYPPGSEALAWHFPLRNRIIAAMSRGILLTEARRKSGSLITAELGLGLGKDIFALPGRIRDPLSEGTNLLIQGGAKCVLTPEDILSEYNMVIHHTKKTNFKLAKIEKLVYDSMCLVPGTPDEICLRVGLGLPEVLKILLSLEMKGAIRRVGKNQYVLSL